MKELNTIQTTLKAPKSQKNKFGNYNYRSCEDILEAVKPLLAETECTLVISDEVVAVFDRVYVKATTTLTNSKGDSVSNTAFAREAVIKKGMDDSQITGAASSYARKYALNGLFCIDDTKDADSNNTHGKGPKKQFKANSNAKEVIDICTANTIDTNSVIDAICNSFTVNKTDLKSIDNMTDEMIAYFKQNQDWFIKNLSL